MRLCTAQDGNQPWFSRSNVTAILLLIWFIGCVASGLQYVYDVSFDYCERKKSNNKTLLPFETGKDKDKEGRNELGCKGLINFSQKRRNRVHVDYHNRHNIVTTTVVVSNNISSMMVAVMLEGKFNYSLCVFTLQAS